MSRVTLTSEIQADSVHDIVPKVTTAIAVSVSAPALASGSESVTRPATGD